MKTIAIAFCFLCATAAFGQNAPVISNNPQPTEVPDHPWHASQHSMATDSNLRGSADYSYEHGDRPLWEFGPVKEERPLGDIARDYRKIHLAERKAAVVMNK
jgi:hypothetical protein